MNTVRNRLHYHCDEWWQTVNTTPLFQKRSSWGKADHLLKIESYEVCFSIKGSPHVQLWDLSMRCSVPYLLQARKALADRQKELELKTQQLEIKLSNKIEEDIKKARRKSTQAGQSQGSKVKPQGHRGLAVSLRCLLLKRGGSTAHQPLTCLRL